MPERAVLDTLLPLLPALEVTRVADQTGLDVIGIPVAAAFRPNSRSIAVHQGKGLTRAAAQVSAIMEAAECFLAENPLMPLRRAAVGELPDAIAIDRLPRRADPHPAQRFLWAEGVDLIAGRPRWVPFELVHADFTAPAEPGLFTATTNGMGAGQDTTRSRSHALWELLERDAIARWRQAGGPAARDASPLDLDTVDDPACRTVLDRLRALAIRTAVWRVPSRVGAAAFQALLLPPDGGLAGIEPEMGGSFHPDPALALLGALTEAAQSRVTRIAGARDDYDPASYAPAARAERMAQAVAWFALSVRRPAVPMPRPAGMPDRRRWLAEHLEALARDGCGEAVWIDLTHPALPIACGRMVVPGLSGPFAA